MTARENASRDFSLWLRTGWRPRSGVVAGSIEYKFNPWHDPANGRFTTAGTGQRAGAPGEADRGRIRPKAPPGQDPAGIGRSPGGGTSGRAAGAQGAPSSKPLSEFAGGVAEGLYGVAEGTVEGVRDALTTNPLTTVRKLGHAIAGTIDDAIAAEDVPARIQASRAAHAMANASARDIGRATGSIAGNVVLGVVPEAALSKLATVRRLRLAKPRPTYHPPQIG